MTAVSIVWNIGRDMYVVLLVIFLIEQIPGADLLDENMRKVIVSVTVVVVITKVLQMLLDSGDGGGTHRGPNREKKVDQGKVATLEWASAEMQGWRPAMEDATCIAPSLASPLEQYALFAVFDGHGGSQVSNIASKEFPKVLAACAGNQMEKSFVSCVDSGSSGEEGSGGEEKKADKSGKEVVAADELKSDDAAGQEKAASELSAADVAATLGVADPVAQDSGDMTAQEAMIRKALHLAMLTMDSVLRKGGNGLAARMPMPMPLEARRLMAPAPEKRNAFDLVGSTAIIALLEFGEEEESGSGGSASSTKEAQGAAVAPATDAGCERPLSGAAAGAAGAAAGGLQARSPATSAIGALPLRITVANCGDSRAVLCRKGRAVELSEDHKPELKGEEERIRKAGGCVAQIGPCHRIDRCGLNLSRALGDFHYKARADLPPEQQKVVAVPEIRTLELTPDDEFLVLGCDGIFELHTSQRVIDIVRQGLQAGHSVVQVAKDLVDKSCSPNLMKSYGKGGDNCSAIVIRLPPRS